MNQIQKLNVNLKHKSRYKAIEIMCANCGMPFLKRDKAYRGTTQGRLRPSNTITCSHHCSIAYVDKGRIAYSRRKRYGT